MKLTPIEHNAAIELSIEPETIAEAAFLMRLASQTKKDVEVRTFFSGSSIGTYLRFGKKRNMSSSISNSK